LRSAAFAGLIEISENLHRAELSVLERAKLVKEWVEMTGNKLPQVGAVSGGRGNESGVRLAARQLPVDGDTEKAREHRIARDLKIASLSPEAEEEARAAGLDDNQSALLEAAKHQTPEARSACTLRSGGRHGQSAKGRAGVDSVGGLGCGLGRQSR
jgi:hypothetical protein